MTDIFREILFQIRILYMRIFDKEDYSDNFIYEEDEEDES
tara:strand:- start:1689 stop:1808 length:120 start_codon:yes stop_codon:yes gene_type:complete